MAARRTLKRCTLLGVLTLAAALLQAPHPAHALASGAAGYAWADFNDDGFADLAIGAPGEAIGARKSAGVVHILFGTGDGLISGFNQMWSQDTEGVAGSPEAGDNFGAALAAGDFNGDGQDDLAIASPGESIESATKTGTVTVLYASKPGALKATGSELLRQGGAGIGGNIEDNDAFGSSLSTGDFDADGFDDLAVGVPGESANSVSGAGAVQILNGASDGGLSGAGGETINQDTAGVPGAVESGDRFGHALTSGDFDGDGKDDLAVGVPYEGIDAHGRAGAVYAIYGSADGPDPQTTHLMTQDTIFQADESQANDAFGFALAAGDFNPGEAEQSYDDLAIGAPGDLDGSPGAVNIVNGSNEGFVDTAEVWYQGKAGNTGAVSGTRESGDDFGYSLTANDFNGDSFCDLAIGVPHEDSPQSNEGGVNVIYSDGGGLEPGVGPSQFWGQDSNGVAGVGESGDTLGHVVSSGDFNGDGHDDLVMGAHLEDLGRSTDSGVVHVLYGADTKLTGTNSDLWHQGIPGIKGTTESGDRFGGSAG